MRAATYRGRDHPHACGDKRYRVNESIQDEGSSPRVWGQVCKVCSKLNEVRIIPTRVGTSDTFSSDTPQGRDHPHACGDKMPNIVFAVQVLGSSPRVWGQVAQVLNASWDKRIIPTRVGTRESTKAHPSKLEDHPHACGDKQLSTTAHTRRSGSSPRVWGQVDIAVNTADSAGIIPTRVGTRCENYLLFCLTSDHPHACGDKLLKILSCVCLHGSSPRVWGQERQRILIPAPTRIIPTRVGTR